MLKNLSFLVALGLLSAAQATATVIGYWDQGWEQVTPPAGANLSVTFSGDSVIATALEKSADERSRMVGERFLGLGGGNEAGGWTAAKVEAVITDLEAGKLVGYEGVGFDVEICDEEGLAEPFSRVFAAAKRQNLTVLVTVSHSEPYGCKDTTALMKSFLAEPNIDYLSPQLYTTGEEKENDYTAVGTPWSAYADARAAIVPSLARASMYQAAEKYFASEGVVLDGFIAWGHP